MALQEWIDRAGAGAVPIGRQQQQEDIGATGGPGLQQWTDRASQFGAPGWQTGGRTGGTESGWNTNFYDQMFKQREAAEKSGRLHELPFQQDFTGVVTYDQTLNGQRRSFGDIYEDGRFQGNVLKGGFGLNEDEGYQLLSRLTLDAKEQQETYRSYQKNPNAIKEAVTARAEETAKEVASFQTQQAYQSELDATREEWDDGTSATLITLGGAGVGAAMGAGIGSVVPVLGTAVGAVAGGILGGLSSWLNRDEIEQQAARATVQTEMAGEQFGTPGSLATGLREWTAVGTSFINPVGNLIRGGTDAIVGETGDGRSEYYEMENRHWLLTGLNLGGTLIDAGLQFASPIGQGLFMASMSGTVAGSVAQLSLQGGATFDDRRGDFHAPETAGQWAAAIGTVGIDAVQMIGGRGIYNAGRRSLTPEGTALKQEWNAAAKEWQVSPSQFVNRQGEAYQVVGGRTFFFDASGAVSRSRTNLTTLMAPSEATTWLGARARALVNRSRARETGVPVPSMDEALYRAALDIDMGTNLAQTVLLNAIGEGTEEAIQAVLEPISHGWTPDPNEIIEAFAMGAAMGAGMSLGARYQRVSRSEQQRFMANQTLISQGRDELSRERWEKMSPAERTLYAPKPETVSDTLLEAMAGKVLESRAQTELVLNPAASRILDAAQQAAAQEQANALSGIEGTYVITGHTTADIPGNEVRTSAQTILELLESHWAGIGEKISVETDAAVQAELEAILSEAEGLRPELQNLIRIMETQGEVQAQEALRQFNERLRNAFNSTSSADARGDAFTPLAKAVSLVLSRDPNNSAGSFQMVYPQALLKQTLAGEHGALQVGFGILKAIGGDFDGDKMTLRVRLASESPALYRDLRTGMNMLQQTGDAVKIGIRESEKQIITWMGAASYEGGSARANAEAAAYDIKNWLEKNFARVPDIKGIAKDFASALLLSDTGAKTTLLNRLFQGGNVATMQELALEGTTDLAPGSHLPLAIDHKINSRLQEWSTAFGVRRQTPEGGFNTTEVSPIPASNIEGTYIAAEMPTQWLGMDAETEGVEPFREAQKLYYSALRSMAGSREHWDLNSDQGGAVLLGYQQLYTAITSSQGRSTAEEALAGDALGKAAVRILSNLSDTFSRQGTDKPMQMGALAGMRIPDFRQDDSGVWQDFGDTTVAQYVLREAAREVRADQGMLSTLNPEKTRELDTILNGRGPDFGDAFFRIFEGFQARYLLGEAGNNLKLGMTMRQIRAEYASMGDQSRRAYRNALMRDARAANLGDAPVMFEQFEAGTANPYSVFVSALRESVDKELYFDSKKKKSGGRLWDQDQALIKDLEEALTYARQGMERLADMYGLKRRLKKKVNVEGIMRMAESNPDFARSLMNLLPTDTVTLILHPTTNGTVKVPQWLAEILVNPSSKKSAYTYFQQVTLAQWQLVSKKTHPHETQDRLMQLMLRLSGDPVENAVFQEIFYKAESITDFLEKVNARYYQEGPPQLAFFRESARFDPNLQDGGWTMAFEGAEHREAIANFRKAANRLHAFSASEYARFEDNERYYQTLRNEMTKLDAGQRTNTDLVRVLGERLRTSAQMPRPMGPNGLMLGPLALAAQLQGSLTDKGKAPASVLHYGTKEVMGNTPVVGIGAEQVLDSLTSIDASDVANNTGLLAGMSLRLADDRGRPFEWTIPDDPTELSRMFIELYGRPENRPMLEAIFFPTVYEMMDDGSGRLTQQLLTDMDLRTFVENDTYGKMLNFDREGEGDFTTDMEYMSMVNAFASKNGAPNEAVLLISDHLNARISAADKVLTPEEVASMQQKITRGLVRLFRAIGENQHEDVVKAIHKTFREMEKSTFMGHRVDDILDSALKESLVSSLLLTPTPEQAADPTASSGINRYNEMLLQAIEGGDFAEYATKYIPNWDDPSDAIGTQQLLLEEMRLLNAQTYSQAVRELLNPALPTRDGIPYVGHPDSSTERELWDEAARAVISIRIQNAIAPSGSTIRVPLLPAEALDSWRDALRTGDHFRLGGNARFFDPSYRYLADDLLDPDSILNRSIREFHDLAKGPEGLGSATIPSTEIFDALGELLNPNEFGPWSQLVVRRTIDSRNRINSAGVNWQIALAGIAYAKQSTAMAASERDYTIPPQGLLSEYTLDHEVLEALAGDHEIDLFDRNKVTHADASRNESLVILNGRFVKEMILSYVDENGDPQQIDLAQKTPGRISAAIPFEGVGVSGQVIDSMGGYKHTDLQMIRMALRHLHPTPSKMQLKINMFHPADRPAEMARHNIFFEGVAGQGNSDRGSSILTSLWMGLSGLNVIEQDPALQSQKNATQAYKEAQTASRKQVLALETGWQEDLYSVIRAKADVFMKSNLGHHPALDPQFYGAIMTELTMRHVVRVLNEDGSIQLLSAADFIAAQRAGQTFDIASIELVALSQKQRNQLFGEQGVHGLSDLVSSEAFSVDTSGVTRENLVDYTDLAQQNYPQLLEKDFEGSIQATGVFRRSGMQQSRIKPIASRESFDLVRSMFLRAQEKARETHAARNGHGEQNRRMFQAAASRVMDTVLQEVERDPHTALANEGLNLLLPPGINPLDQKAAQLAIHKKFEDALSASPNSRGFVLDIRGNNIKSGEHVLHGLGALEETPVSHHQQKGGDPVLNDLLVIALETAKGPRDTDAEIRSSIEQAVRKAARTNATIGLSWDGPGGTRYKKHAANLLRSMGWERAQLGSDTLWRPPLPDETQSRTLQAYFGKLAETALVPTDGMFLTFLDKSFEGEENMAIVNDRPGVARIETVYKRVPAPTAVESGFGIAINDLETEKVHAQLQAILQTPEMVDHLTDLSMTDSYYPGAKEEKLERDKVRAGIVSALQRAIDSYSLTGGQGERGLPRRGSHIRPGDFLVTIGREGMILNRWGYGELGHNQYFEQMQKTPEQWEGMRIAIGSPRIKQGASTYEGTVRGWGQIGAAGLELDVAVELPIEGDKVVFDENGMKYILTSIANSQIDIPDWQPFQGWDINYFAALPDTLSKESFAGLIDNARDAITYFGIDFTQAFVKTFLDSNMTPAAWEALDPKKRAGLRQQAFEMLDAVVANNNNSIIAVTHMMQAFTGGQSTAAFASLNSILESGIFGEGRKLPDTNALLNMEPEAQIAHMLLIGASSETVTSAATLLSSTGLNTAQRGTDVRLREMPEFFTQAFDVQGTPLHTWFIERLNERLQNQPGVQGGFRLHEDYTFTLQGSERGDIRTGYLQVARATSTGDNPIFNTMAFDRTTRQGLSDQRTRVAELSLGVAPYINAELKKVNKALSGEGFEPLDTAESLTKLLRGDSMDPQYRLFRPMLTRAQQDELALNREKFLEFEEPVDQSEWTPEQRQRVQERRTEIMEYLGWDRTYELRVDAWVRAITGSPKVRDPQTRGAEGRVSYDEYMEATNVIQHNLSLGTFPTSDAVMPGVSAWDVVNFWQAHTSGRGTWRLALPENADDSLLDTFAAVALGEYMTAQGNMPSTHWTALKGYMNTFRDLGTSTFAGMEITPSVYEQLGLLDPARNEMVVTPDSSMAAVLANPTVEHPYTATLRQMADGREDRPRLTSGEIADIYWKKKNGVPEQAAVSMNEIKMGYGRQFYTSGQTTTPLVRTLLNIRGALTMINPFLHVASVGELWRNNIIEQGVEMLTGTGTGLFNQAIAAGQARFDPDASRERSVELMKKAENVARSLARHTEWRRMVNMETLPLEHPEGTGRVEKFTHGALEFGGRLQDATYGIGDVNLARRYVRAALLELDSSYSETTLTADQLLSRLGEDPMFLKDSGLVTLHHAGVKQIERVRTLLPSVMTLMFRGVLDPATRSNRVGLNFISNLAVKLPLMFAPFAFNVTTNILGLQGLNAIAAVALSGKEGGRRWGKLQAALRGEAFDPDRHGINFLEEALESTNLANTFIRGGLTHTGLMGLGLMFQGLGLSGEDEEDRRRRRAAEMQGAGYVYDPRQIESDFRNGSAMYFDNLPDLGLLTDWLRETFEVVGPGEEGAQQTTSMAELHWTLKFFVSPVQGIERYLNTGNWRHIQWGFLDAIGDMPLINANLWDRTNAVAQDLHDAALAAEASGTMEGAGEGFGLIMSAISTYERMLMESSFINSIYVASDKYDRDPYTLVDVDPTGRIQRDDTGQPMLASAMEAFLTDEGQVGEKMIRPDSFEGQLRSWAENRATVAFFGSLFSGAPFGGKSGSMWRQDQAIRTRAIDNEEISDEGARQIILSMWDSEFDLEVPNDEGALAIVRSLSAGVVKADDPALANVWIPYETRKRVFDRLTEEIMVEYLDDGLSERDAYYRTREAMYGSSTNPYVTPLFDVVFSKNEFEDTISYSPREYYRQLNTTYIAGPDGKFWATGIGRDKLNNFFGMAPLQRYNTTGDAGLDRDNLLNSVDDFRNLNTGYRNLEKAHESWRNPTIEDILEDVNKGFEEVTDAIKEAAADIIRGDGYGGSGGYYSRSGRRGYGGGGGGGYASFYRLSSPERTNPIYNSNDPYLRVDDPYIRRAQIRRERYSSQRGRLNQWQ